MDEILWHRRESRRKRRKQTSSCSHGRLLSTRTHATATRFTISLITWSLLIPSALAS